MLCLDLKLVDGKWAKYFNFLHLCCSLYTIFGGIVQYFFVKQLYHKTMGWTKKKEKMKETFF